MKRKLTIYDVKMLIEQSLSRAHLYHKTWSTVLHY